MKINANLWDRNENSAKRKFYIIMCLHKKWKNYYTINIRAQNWYEEM